MGDCRLCAVPTQHRLCAVDQKATQIGIMSVSSNSAAREAAEAQEK
uniref:Uncharacterized protein n=1 Tax=Pseudomonas aeruginosa TaxID=287 RepID=A0A7S5YBR8_PSEAI|nr:hypothetical protein [Pseudomonas aeruginosa]QNI17595.1 hypothetical protein [Pseudomonas aeruginosa]